MSPETAAQWTLTAYLLLAVVLIGRQAASCEHGWKVWWLYVVERLYVGLVYHWRANRRCPYPDDGPAIIIANHRSPVDPLFLWMNHHLAGTRRRIRAISFLMAREYYEIKSMRWMYRALQCIPVERDGKDMRAVREAIRRLQGGELVGIFPEGRINEGEGLLPPAGYGMAFLALKTKAPVYPAYIHNSPRGRTMLEPFYTPSRVRVTFGEPVDLSAYYDRRRSEELLEEVTDLLMRRIAELGGICYPDSGDPNQTVSIGRATG